MFWLIVVFIILAIMAGYTYWEQSGRHSWQKHQNKKEVTIEFVGGPIGQARILSTRGDVESHEPIVLLVQRDTPNEDHKYFVPATTAQRDWSNSCVVTYTYDTLWSWGIYRYKWLKTNTPLVTTCDRHMYHVTEGPLELRRPSYAQGGCSLEDLTLGQVVSRPTPPLTTPSLTHSTVGVPATLIPSPPIVPMAQRAEKVASIAQEMGLDTGTPKEKP